MSPGRLLLLVLVPAACAPTVDVFPLDEVAPKPVAGPALPVRFYLDQPPRCPHVPLARVTVTPYEIGQELWTQRVASDLRAKARALGADAIVGLRRVTEDGDARLVTSGQRERTRDSTTSRATVAETTAVVRERAYRLEGTAVRFRDEGCRE
jgi:uncharacterized protein YbjQ (UPF0145 family)